MPSLRAGRAGDDFFEGFSKEKARILFYQNAGFQFKDVRHIG